MSRVRAFKVYADCINGGIVVFAQSVSRARSLAFQCHIMDGVEFINLRCKREPEADGYFGDDSERLCEFWTVADYRFYRSLGWYQIDNQHMMCTVCDLYQWDDVPESILIFDGDDFDEGICTGCSPK